MEKPHKRLKLETRSDDNEIEDSELLQNYYASMHDEDKKTEKSNLVPEHYCIPDTYDSNTWMNSDTTQLRNNFNKTVNPNVKPKCNVQSSLLVNDNLNQNVSKIDTLKKDRNEESGEWDLSDDKPTAMAAENAAHQEAVQELKQFLVLDDLNQESDIASASDSESDYNRESDDVPDEEIEAMLDEGLPDDYNRVHKKRQIPYDQKQKLVLEEKGVNHFEVLPLGWLAVTHNSGMPLYLHKPSRVCSMSKPYFLGPGSVRKHQIPISAIPCLSYRRALLEEEKSEFPNESCEQSESNPASNAGSNDNNVESLTTALNNETRKCPYVKELQNGLDGQDCKKEKSDDVAVNEEKCERNDTEYLRANGSNNGNKINGDTLKKIVNPELFRKLVNSDNIEEGQVPLGPFMPSARVETAQENWMINHLVHKEVTDYCKKLFKFKSINIMRFKSWSDRRKFSKTKKALQRPTLPDGTKLITFPVSAPTPIGGITPDEGGFAHKKTARKECLMNPNGKSYVCILHEYVQRALKKQPTYEFKELENGETPYSATVSINGMRYGVGYGTSKRQAKSAAAKTSIEILIPEMRKKIAQDEEISGTTSRNNDQDLAFFDDIEIEDPRIADLSSKTMEPSPHTVLQTCLARNFGIGDREIKYHMNTLKHQKNEFTMTVGKHTVTIVCKNKRDGKQRASQAILKALHPNINSWGSLLRLYGTRSMKSFKEKKQEEQEITLLQSQAAVNQPNYAILDKLRVEMTKLRGRDLEVTPIGTMTMQEDLPTHSGSNLNNVDL